MKQILVKRLPHAKDLPIPTYATEEAAGFDLMAAEDKTLYSGDWDVIKTGLIMQIPRGFEGQIRPRSGLALKNGITVLNAPGTIDSDYRGEIGVILINHSAIPFYVTRGMRIAQMVIAPVERISMIREWDELGCTERGSGGFGSTGT